MQQEILIQLIGDVKQSNLGTIILDTATVHGGTYSLKMANVLANSKHYAYITPLFTTDVSPVIALNVANMVSKYVHCYITSQNVPGDGTVQIQISYYNNMRNSLSGSQQTSATLNAGWALTSIGPLVIPTGAAYFRINCNAIAVTAWPSNAAAWFDDFTLSTS